MRDGLLAVEHIWIDFGMRIANILITYSYYPAKLFDSIRGSSHETRWHVFFHGPDAGLGARIGRAVSELGGEFHDYGRNRGVARSWNEGLLAAVEQQADVSLLLNDDLFFYAGGYDAYMDFVAQQYRDVPSMGLAYVNGLESGGSPFAGRVQFQGFACCAVMPRTVARIGYFDENFRPAYYEDSDYHRRVILSGLSISVDERSLVEHERSKTTRDNPALLARNAETMAVNGAYFQRKWGGEPVAARFHQPFDRAEFPISIPYERRAAPYGPPFDRSD